MVVLADDADSIEEIQREIRALEHDRAPLRKARSLLAVLRGSLFQGEARPEEYPSMLDCADVLSFAYDKMQEAIERLPPAMGEILKAQSLGTVARAGLLNDKADEDRSLLEYAIVVGVAIDRIDDAMNEIENRRREFEAEKDTQQSSGDESNEIEQGPTPQQPAGGNAGRSDADESTAVH